MLDFDSLKLSQKKAVVAIVNHTPQLRENGRVTLKEIVAITQDLASKREEGAPKIGYPNWLFKHNKIERGVYQLPIPNETQIREVNEAIHSSAKKKKTGPVLKVDNTYKKDAEFEKSELQKVIDDMDVFETHPTDEEFLQELRDNGIQV